MNEPQKYYFLVANPKQDWSFSKLNIGEVEEFPSINENGNKRQKINCFKEIKKGDMIVAYDSRDSKSILGLCVVDEKLDDNSFKIKKLETLINPIQLIDLKKKPELVNMEYFSGYQQATLFKLEESEYKAIYEMIRKSNPIDENIIYYGAPGCGKSHKVSEILNKKYGKNNYDRILFHPEYTYSDFVGQILPSVDETNGSKTIKYEFKAGPFTRILAKALNNEDEPYCLVIEEINRGNASAIFGDIFQLMDRRKEYDSTNKDENGYRPGDSEYAITNKDISDWLLKEKKDEKEVDQVDVSKLMDGEKIYIPHNLSIYATMNTSDQNVFVLDTAFKRRWKLRYVPIDFSEDKELFNENIPLPKKQNIKMTWREFAEKLNQWIPTLNNGINSDDKLIGQYFISKEELENSNDFAQKIFLYLWNDVAKTDRYALFKKEVNGEKINTLENLINAYEKHGLDVFVDTIFNKKSDASSNEEEEIIENE